MSAKIVILFYKTNFFSFFFYFFFPYFCACFIVIVFSVEAIAFEDNRPKSGFGIDEKRTLIIEASAVFGGGEIKCK